MSANNHTFVVVSGSSILALNLKTLGEKFCREINFQEGPHAEQAFSANDYFVEAVHFHYSSLRQNSVSIGLAYQNYRNAAELYCFEGDEEGAAMVLLFAGPLLPRIQSAFLNLKNFPAANSAFKDYLQTALEKIGRWIEASHQAGLDSP